MNSIILLWRLVRNGGGPEAERDQLRKRGFTLLSMGSRVLRQETAVVASLSQVVGQFWNP